MNANTATKANRNGARAKRKPSQAKLRGLKSLDCIDRRTFAGRRMDQLTNQFETDLGGADRLTAGQRQLAQHSAFLGAVIESGETEWLLGLPVDMNELRASINTQRRELRDLGLERRARDVTPTLSDYLNQNAETLDADTIDADTIDAEDAP